MAAMQQRRNLIPIQRDSTLCPPEGTLHLTLIN